MKLCSMTGGRLGLWRNRGRRDDRPFPPRKILPIAGFRGNRVMYGESWWTPEEEEDAGQMMEGSYNPRALEPEEPVYSEPNFARGGDDVMVPPHLSSPDSGYLSFGRPGLSSCSSDTEGSLASLAPGEFSLKPGDSSPITTVLEERRIFFGLNHELCIFSMLDAGINRFC